MEWSWTEAGLRLVVDGNGGVGVFFQTAEAVGKRAADKGDLQSRRLFRRVVKAAAQQDQSQQPLGAGQLSGGPDLVFAGRDLVEDHGVARLVHRLLHRPDDGGEEGVAHAADHQANGVGLGTDQIPGAAVGNVVQLPHGLQDPGTHGLADVGMVVEDTGNRADGNAAVLRYILDGHAVSTPFF